jgi:hypothetical protein
MAHRVISLPRSNSVTFGLKRTSAGFYEYAAWLGAEWGGIKSG